MGMYGASRDRPGSGSIHEPHQLGVVAFDFAEPLLPQLLDVAEEG
jgi:hypothetical protein